MNELLIFYYRLSTFGNAGSSHLDYPKDSDLMESFHCNQTQVNRSVGCHLVMKARLNSIFLLNKFFKDFHCVDKSIARNK